MTNSLLDIPAQDPALGADTLRLWTALEHREVERTLALPGSIQTMADYRLWLIRFFGIYQPLEHLLSSFEGWTEAGIRIDQLGHTQALLKDLQALGCDPGQIELASRQVMPIIQTLGQAFGALYVLEGSKLGGRYILKDLSNRLGCEIEGIATFFTGYGVDTAIQWASFKESLDRFSALRPAEFPEVIAGARMTYAAIGAWMSPLAGPAAKEILSTRANTELPPAEIPQ